MVKAVLDTNVIVSGLFWRGTPHRCLLAARSGLYELVISDEILEELANILLRKFHLTDKEVKDSVQFIRKIGHRVEVTERMQVVRDDPADDKFLEVATAAGANIIVSGDRHLLGLSRYKNIQILNVNEFLNQILREDT